MFDYVKKVNKRAGDLLLPGENVLAACPVQIPGYASKSRSNDPAIALVKLVARTLKTDPALPDVGSMASEFPLTMTILAVTDYRVIAFESTQVTTRPKGILKEWSRDELIGLTVGKGKASYPIEISFSDGSAITMEVAKAGRPQKVAAVLAS